MISKEIWSLIAVILTIYGSFNYIWGVLYKGVKPHLFTGLIWGSSSVIVSFAQYEDGAGVGAIPILVAGIISLYIAYLSYTRMTDHMITPIDWVFLLAALGTIPVWYFTDSPMWSAVILSIIDVVGSFPTIRKTYYYPNEERTPPYTIALWRNITSILALESYNVTTLSFPILSTLPIIVIIALIVIRGDSVAKMDDK